MKRDVRETIVRNREALGMSTDDALFIDTFVNVNKNIYVNSFVKAHEFYRGNLNVILADGLIVGYES